MQFEDEGVETVDVNETKFNLEEHLVKHGLSSRAISKMKGDIDSGDMNVNILKECNENELVSMCNDYNLTFLQKKAFIKAVKNLGDNNIHNNSSNNNNNNNNNSNNNSTQFVFVSPKDQQFLNQIKDFLALIKTFQTKQLGIKNGNKTEIDENIQILKRNANKMKNVIDNIVNTIENNVCMNVLDMLCKVV